MRLLERIARQHQAQEPPSTPSGRRWGTLIKGVYKFGEVASAMQKEIRRGDERAAMFWCHLLYEKSPYYCVDEETECLSQRGWLRGCDLKVGDRAWPGVTSTCW